MDERNRLWVSCFAGWSAACVVLLCSNFCTLQQALPSNVVLGDFNARVGSRVVDDLW